MTHHFLNLEGAATLTTRGYELAQRNFQDVAANRAIGLFYGDAGLGKTYAVETAAARCELPVCWLNLPHGVTPKQLLQQLLSALIPGPHRGTITELEIRLLEELSNGARVLALDEAQHLNFRGVEYLRHLWDHRETELAIALVGGHGCPQLIARYPSLRSRIWRKTPFRPMKPDDVAAAIPQYHRIYRQSDPQLIRWIDREYAGGVLRNWASFTKTADELMREHNIEQLSDKVVRAVFALHSGAADAA